MFEILKLLYRFVAAFFEFLHKNCYIRLSADIHTALAAKYKASFVILLVSSYISMM